LDIVLANTRYKRAGLNALRLLAILAIFGWFLSPKMVHASDKDLPFQPGEKLIFEIRWSFIPAGKAVLEVLPIESFNGIESYHFVLTVRTNSFVDHFYKVRDRIDAYADVQMNRSLLFKKKQREGRSKKDILVEFDWGEKHAQYSNFGKKRRPVSIPPGTFDPLSAFYFTRLFDWQNQKEVKRPVTDGKKIVIGKARLVKRETIKVPVGTYDTYLFEPDIEHVGGVFEKSKDAKIELWITADKRRIPVRLRSKVIVGSFVGELVSMTGVDRR